MIQAGANQLPLRTSCVPGFTPALTSASPAARLCSHSARPAPSRAPPLPYPQRHLQGGPDQRRPPGLRPGVQALGRRFRHHHGSPGEAGTGCGRWLGATLRVPALGSCGVGSTGAAGMWRGQHRPCIPGHPHPPTACAQLIDNWWVKYAVPELRKQGSEYGCPYGGEPPGQAHGLGKVSSQRTAEGAAPPQRRSAEPRRRCPLPRLLIPWPALLPPPPPCPLLLPQQPCTMTARPSSAATWASCWGAAR